MKYPELLKTCMVKIQSTDGQRDSSGGNGHEALCAMMLKSRMLFSLAREMLSAHRWDQGSAVDSMNASGLWTSGYHLLCLRPMVLTPQMSETYPLQREFRIPIAPASSHQPNRSKSHPIAESNIATANSNQKSTKETTV
jgi:hypothetical protein